MIIPAVIEIPRSAHSRVSDWPDLGTSTQSKPYDRHDPKPIQASSPNGLTLKRFSNDAGRSSIAVSVGFQLFLNDVAVWCCTCQQEVPGTRSGVGLDVACNYCGTASVHHPSTIFPPVDHRGAAQASPDLIRVDEPSLLDNSVPQPHCQAEGSAPRRASVNTSSPSQTQIRRIDEIRVRIEREKTQQAPEFPRSGEPMRMTGFFILFFLFGQVIATWAFISSHFAAWLSGIAFSVTGLTVAVFSLLSQLDWQRSRIRELQTELDVKLKGAKGPQSPAPQPHISLETRISEKVTA